MPLNPTIKSGYKQTEVGVIPEDWNVLDYVSFGQVIDGDRGSSYPGTGDLRDNGYCLFLNAGNVTKVGFRFADCQFISAENDNKLNKGRLVRGDVVLTTRGSIGHFAYFDSKVPFEHLRINSGMVILRNTSQAVSNAYLYLVLRSHIGELQLERLSFGSAQPQLTVKGISTLKIPLPPTKAEQEAIAETLSNADTLIESLEQIIAKKRDLKQAAMQQLLTSQTRLPGFSGEWEVKRLGDIAEIISGGTPKTSEPNYWNGSIRWCTPTDITGCSGKYLVETERTISADGLASCSARLLPVGSLLLCSRATIGEVRIAGCEICTNQGFKSLVCRPGVSNEFLYYKLLTMKSQMVERAIGSTFLEISKRGAAALELSVPDHTEQIAIATVLSDMDAEIAALEQRRDKTRDIKQGMAQELLTGKTRLI